MQVWRKASTGFKADEHGTNYFIKVSKLNVNKPILNAGCSNQVRIYPGPLSAYKTINFMPYVLAGVEMENKGWDEIVILNYQGYVCECSIANIFWTKNDTFFTPPLHAGCIDGIMRGKVIHALKEKGERVLEEFAEVEQLLQADTIFSTNVTGIRPFHKFMDRQLVTDLSLPAALTCFIT